MSNNLGILESADSKVSSEEKVPRSAFDFVSIGVGCFALTLIHGVGILSMLIDDGYFDAAKLTEQKKIKNRSAVQSALLSLHLCKILSKRGSRYFLTQLGLELAQRVGLISMVFDGYGRLMANGIPIALGKINQPSKYLNGAAIALASIQFGENVDPVVIDTVKKLKLRGTICDVGCGSADRLLKLCNATALPGLGLDACVEAIKIARKRTEKYAPINIEFGDATDLKGVWEDVQILMQCFMTHDIFPDEQFIRVLGSYRNNFPNMKYFLVVDIVAPNDDASSHMPAYDYVHGLLGIETRTYDRYTTLLSKSGYKIIKEVQVDGLPNTYLWVLKPHL